MKARFLRSVLVLSCLVAVSGTVVFAKGQHPGGAPPPPGNRPMGAPPNGGPLQPPSMVGPHRNPGKPAHSSVQFGPVGRWWDDKSMRQTVGLRQEQQKRMDTIFNANKPAIVAAYKTFLAEQSKLAALNKDPHVDQTQLFAQIDAVSQARASLQKATAQMMLAIRNEMDPDQIEKLENLP